MKPGIDLLWTAMLKLQESLKTFDLPFSHAILSFPPEGPKIYINSFDQSIGKYPSVVISRNAMRNLNGNHSRFSSTNLMDVEVLKSGTFEDSEIEFLKQYLPYALLPIHARKYGRTLSVSHFAQSLDGKIATNSGSSQWIGNQENLVHAHRMRSLCDAILIGSKTLINDNPSLTVREVSGEDPVKVVVGRSDNLNFSKLLQDNAQVIYVTDKKSNQPTELEILDTSCRDGVLCCPEILEQLYKKGIFSIYIEGGSKTASNFLNDEAIDIVQLHIAPMIMGSGINCFSLPEINCIDQSIGFSHFKFQSMGNHMMFTGQVKKTK